MLSPSASFDTVDFVHEHGDKEREQRKDQIHEQQRYVIPYQPAKERHARIVRQGNVIRQQRRYYGLKEHSEVSEGRLHGSQEFGHRAAAEHAEQVRYERQQRKQQEHVIFYFSHA